MPSQGAASPLPDELLSDDGLMDWLQQLNTDAQTAGYLRQIAEACLHIRLTRADRRDPEFAQSFALGLETVRRLAPLKVDRHCLGAGFLYPFRATGCLLSGQPDCTSSETEKLLHSIGNLPSTDSEKWNIRLLGQKQSQSENIRNMVLTMSDNLQVILLLLAERTGSLHRAVETGAPHCRSLARKVLRIYAPIAGRLGVHRLKDEMEDCCLRALAPRQIGRVADTVQELRSQWESAVKGVAQTLAAELDRAGIENSVESRIKNLYSIWRKMRRKGVSLNHLHDVLGIRIIVSSVADCYRALGCVHGLWSHLADEFDDYIGNAKPNGYRSIHTAVVVPRVGTFEVQIRTADMEREAEFGACAHWQYKGQHVSNPWFESRMTELRRLASRTDDALEPSAVAEILLEDSMRDRIYVFTRDGDTVELPKGATLLDFAYHVHTDVGHRCVGGFVNDIPASLRHRLRNGQSVEVSTQAGSTPREEWLDFESGFVTTVRARHALQRWFRRLSSDRFRERGERLLMKEIERTGLAVTALHPLARALKQKTVDDLLIQFGSKRLPPGVVRRELAKLAKDQSTS